MGFGIFYMMVNIGGFVGPIVAGVVRGWDWKYVFCASAGWIVVMGITCLLLYREPPRDDEAESRRASARSSAAWSRSSATSASSCSSSACWSCWSWARSGGASRDVAVVAGALAGRSTCSSTSCFAPASATRSAPWPLQPMRVGEGRYLVFLLLMAGFWTSFNQIFMTLPEYIRDYVDTSDLIGQPRAAGGRRRPALDLDTSWSRALLDNGQVKPEYLINLNAFGIICFQVLISYLVRKPRR